MKKLGILCLILIIALGTAGVGYATWAQGLIVTGNINVAAFNVVFDSFAKPDDINGATFSATKVNDQWYSIGLNNLYPSLNATFTFVIKNNSDVTVKITDIKLDGSSRTTENKDITSPTDGKYDITVTVQDISTSTTLAPHTSVTGHLLVHTWKLSPDGNDATAGASGGFTFEFDTAQQN